MSLYRRPGSKFWQCEFEVGGERIQKSTREEDRERAVRAELRFKLAAREAAPRVRRGPGSLRELAALDVLDATDAKTTSNHIRSLRWMWKAIDAHFGADARVDAITLDSMKDYVRDRERQGIRGQSIRREISALKRACRIAVRKGWLSSFPSEWPRVKSDAPDARRRGKLRSADEIAAVAALCSPSARDLIHFAAMTGLRRHELARVRLEWMQATSAGPILVVPPEASKTRSEREIALSARAVEILRRRDGRERLGKSLPIFAPHTASVRDSIKRASKEAGLSSTLTLRDLRHYYSTVGLAASGDAVAVQSQMGHTDLRTTERYQHSTRERAAAVSALVAESLQVGSPTVAGEKREDPDSSESSATSVVGAAGFEPTAPCTPSIVPRVITVTCCDSCVAALRDFAAKCAAGSRHEVPDMGTKGGHQSERKKAG